jgi:hypothetical protein
MWPYVQEDNILDRRHFSSCEYEIFSSRAVCGLQELFTPLPHDGRFTSRTGNLFIASRLWTPGAVHTIIPWRKVHFKEKEIFSSRAVCGLQELFTPLPHEGRFTSRTKSFHREPSVDSRSCSHHYPMKEGSLQGKEIFSSRAVCGLQELFTPLSHEGRFTSRKGNLLIASRLWTPGAVRTITPWRKVHFKDRTCPSFKPSEQMGDFTLPVRSGPGIGYLFSIFQFPLLWRRKMLWPSKGPFPPQRSL